MDPGRQIASLREAWLLVRGLAGASDAIDGDSLLDEAARFSSAYERAAPVVQRQFDAAAGEMTAWAAAGVEALLAAGDSPPPAPAQRLALAMEDGLARLGAMLRLG